MNTLANKLAVVTGGNSGIGFAAAKELQQQGATLIITGRRKDAVGKAAAALNATGVIADQSSLPDIDKLAEAISNKKIDILLINAGITKLSPIEHTTESMFDEIMNINFKGAYFTLSKLIPLLNDGASVIFLSSTSSTISPQHASVYAASKAAINAVMKIAALELAPKKIRVNAVSPGPVATEIMDKLGLSAALEKQLISSIPLARLGQPEEIASLIAFLAGDKASFITGSYFLADGGQSI